MTKPFFTFEDFLSIKISREFVNYDNLCGVTEATVLANAKVAPLLQENEALKKLLHAANDEWAAAEKRAEQLIKQLRICKEALENIENDDGSIPNTIWRMRNEAIAAVKKLEGK